MKLIVACATDDEHTLSSAHFGSASKYAILEMGDTTCTRLQHLSNRVNTCEEGHTDPQKAKNIIHLLTDRQVQVVVAKCFGPNIGRIKRSFVPVIVKADTLEDGCMKLLKNRDAIVAELHKGKTRNFLLLS